MKSAESAGMRYYPVTVGKQPDVEVISAYYPSFTECWSDALEEYGSKGIPFSIPLYYYHIQSKDREVILSELELPAYIAEGGWVFKGLPHLANNWMEAKQHFCPKVIVKSKLDYKWG